MSEVTVESIWEIMRDFKRRAEGGGRTLVESSLDNMTLAKLREEFPQLNVVTTNLVPDGQVFVVDQDKVDEQMRRPIRFEWQSRG